MTEVPHAPLWWRPSRCHYHPAYTTSTVWEAGSNIVDSVGPRLTPSLVRFDGQSPIVAPLDPGNSKFQECCEGHSLSIAAEHLRSQGRPIADRRNLASRRESAQKEPRCEATAQCMEARRRFRTRCVSRPKAWPRLSGLYSRLVISR